MNILYMHSVMRHSLGGKVEVQRRFGMPLDGYEFLKSKKRGCGLRDSCLIP